MTMRRYLLNTEAYLMLIYFKIYAENEEEVLEPPEYEYEESEKEPLNDNAV